MNVAANTTRMISAAPRRLKPELLHLADQRVEQVAERDAGGEGRDRRPEQMQDEAEGPRARGPRR